MKPPGIALCFEAKGDLLLSVQVDLSSRFSLSFSEASRTLQLSLERWVENYLSGKSAPLPQLPAGTPFQVAVWNALAQIPFGKTASYQEIGDLIGKRSGARAVGNACGKNPFLLLIPCHRVIRENGELGGFAKDIKIKKTLLEFEASF